MRCPCSFLEPWHVAIFHDFYWNVYLSNSYKLRLNIYQIKWWYMTSIESNLNWHEGCFFMRKDITSRSLCVDPAIVQQYSLHQKPFQELKDGNVWCRSTQLFTAVSLSLMWLQLCSTQEAMLVSNVWNYNSHTSWFLDICRSSAQCLKR